MSEKKQEKLMFDECLYIHTAKLCKETAKLYVQYFTPKQPQIKTLMQE